MLAAVNQPLVPLTQASSAPETWRALPAAPRSCLTASMMSQEDAPHAMPGWPDERPPPSVLVGSAARPELAVL